jgi:Cu/Zn superoxide dismutase
MHLRQNVRALTAVAAIALVSALATVPAGADAPSRARGAGALRDLQLGSEQPTDHATAQVVAIEQGSVTTVTLKVQGIDHSAAGSTYGAHVHVGSCVEGNGTAAGPHYNATGGSTVSDETEVWLDFTVAADGTAFSSATVPFIIPTGGAGSVVIHAQHTNHDTGAAGARWACLPVEF